MALLNPPQTLPHVMFLVYRYLLLGAEKQAEHVDVLRTLLAPPSLRHWQSESKEEDAEDSDDDDGEAREQRVVRIALKALSDLGVIQEDGGTVRLNPELPVSALSRKTGGEQFRRLLRDRILDKNANSDLWREEGEGKKRKAVGPRDLTRALCWTLAQDVYQLVRPWKEPSGDSVQQLQQRQLGQEQRNWVFSNDTRWPAFIRWAVYLGFGWTLGVPKSGSVSAQLLFAPDPTEAIRDVIPRIAFKPGTKLSLPEFLERLASELPVLDGGEYREAVLERINARTLALPNADELSTSLAHALLRLADDEVIALMNESDIEKRLFPTGSGDPRPFSHIRIESYKPREVMS